MKKYKAVTISISSDSKDINERLNNIAELGWELSSTQYLHSSAYYTAILFIFERSTYEEND